MKSFALNSAAAPLHTASQLVSAVSLRAYAFTYSLRGAAVLTAATSDYVLQQMGFAAPWVLWMVIMPVVAIVQNVRARRQRKQGTMGTTATDKAMRLLQKAFVFVLMAMLIGGGFINWEVAHPLILGLYGAGTILAGRLLNFRPLVLGGVACAVLGAVALALPADTQLLVIAVAMLVSHVIPGYLLNRQSRIAA
ncbi:hypothetical protein MTX78_03145 [Hymenobacter tibetensis]|uniref:Uncharacterized protein n=1 Tax=Hymenobacter tibetensis TaxID=497967 RepID=A0ABY4D386_9BACT|nr:hypothetical protein [Hymenobacter tibetensis]UOG75596.1 hypothetical protein MTX78_03145 [Hymenobacter tibetensis]